MHGFSSYRCAYSNNGVEQVEYFSTDIICRFFMSRIYEMGYMPCESRYDMFENFGDIIDGILQIHAKLFC